MINEICANIKNYFAYAGDKFIDTWTITDGVLSPSIDFPADYIRIIGSRLNDGVHKVSEMTLSDETFRGAVWVMSPPKDFLALVAEIEEWQAKNGAPDSVAMSPYNSESFGGYSYSKGGNSDSSSSVPTWQSFYASRLNQYRRIRDL